MTDFNKDITTLKNHTLKSQNDKLDFMNILYNNQFDYKIKLTSNTGMLATTIIKKLRERLDYKGMKAGSYAYLLVANAESVEGYIALLGNQEEPSPSADSFIEAVASIKNITTELSKIDKKTTHTPDYFFNMMDQHTPQKGERSYYTSQNINKGSGFIQGILNDFFDEYFEIYSKKYGTSYPQNYEYLGTVKLNKHRNNIDITIRPFLDQCGNGKIFIIVEKYTGKRTMLDKQLIAAAIVSNYAVVGYKEQGQYKKFHYSEPTSKIPFVYMATDKETKKVIYIGCTTKLCTRIKRHMNSAEKDIAEKFLTMKDISDNSAVKAYFYHKHFGNIKKTTEEIEAQTKNFRTYKVPWEECEISFLPLSGYIQFYKAQREKYLAYRNRKNNHTAVVNFMKKANNEKKIRVVIARNYYKEYQNDTNKNNQKKKLNFNFMVKKRRILNFPTKKEMLTLAEGYCMHSMIEQNPELLFTVERGTEYFNRKIAAYDVPVFYCGTNSTNDCTTDNRNANATAYLLERYKYLIKNSLENAMTSFIKLLTLRDQSICFSYNTINELFEKYGLNFEEAVRLSVGLSLDTTDNNNKQLQHKNILAEYILKQANYTNLKYIY